MNDGAGLPSLSLRFFFDDEGGFFATPFLTGLDTGLAGLDTSGLGPSGLNISDLGSSSSDAPGLGASAFGVSDFSISAGRGDGAAAAGAASFRAGEGEAVIANLGVLGVVLFGVSALFGVGMEEKLRRGRRLVPN